MHIPVRLISMFFLSTESTLCISCVISIVISCWFHVNMVRSFMRRRLVAKNVTNLLPPHDRGLKDEVDSSLTALLRSKSLHILFQLPHRTWR